MMGKGELKRAMKLAREAAANSHYPTVREEAERYCLDVIQHNWKHYSFRGDGFFHDYWPCTRKLWPTIGDYKRAPDLPSVLSAIIMKHQLVRMDAATNGAVGVPHVKKASLPEPSDRVYGEEMPGTLA